MAIDPSNKDLYEAGGVPVLLKALAEGGHLNMNCLTVTGKTIRENLEDIVFPNDQKVIRNINNNVVCSTCKNLKIKLIFYLNQIT